jgi:enamine deaminase RidA (YjgF/YER057c/UK114 family)
LLACAGLAFATAAQAREAPQAIDPPSLPPAHGYSHVVIAPPGRMVSISGQVAMDRAGKVVGEGDFRAQCVQVFENLRTALRSAGLDFKDVVRTDMYVTDLSHLDVLRDVRAQYLPADAPGTSTLVKVDALFRPELMIEVAAEAVLPPGRQPPPR